MRIVFRQVGGFAGLTLVAQVEGRQLSPEAAAGARRLLHARAEGPNEPMPHGEGASGAASAGASAGRRRHRRRTHGSADALAYEITIVEQRRRVTLQFDALEVPLDAHALVDELREAATAEGPPSVNQPPRRRRPGGS